ncbi:MAG TPA: carboxypeptidase regulatory-like domain-containing protein [Bryobacteraceae bacterium]|nr:carboxypeptidase regulatory-like domain-containing protein [Bryobacteraceae bacterium]
MRKLFALLFIAAAAGCGLANAQVTAAISGKIEDATGGGLGGTTVTVKSLETGATRTTTTDQSGDFKILSLPVGAQEVKAEKMGFKSIVRTGINLEVGQEAVVNLQLEVGELTQQITVLAETPVVNTTTSSVSGVVDEREVKDLPLNGRSFDNLIALNPGAINFGLKSANTSTSNGNTFTVAGRRPSENIFLLNGIEYTGSSQLAITPGGVSGQLLGIDAVRELNVLSDTYSAEFGKRAGAQVTVVTQSGTNALHGSVFEFLRNSDLDAKNYFDQGSIPPFRRNQFGGSLGGPVKKDKLFLFGNYEGFRQSLALSNVTVVPDAQVRLGQLPSATTGMYSTPANLNPGMLKYMSLWPDANGPELVVGGVASGAALSFNHPLSHVREDFGTTRADYVLSDRDSLTASYTIDDGNSLIPVADPLFASYSTLRNQVASIQETHILSPAMLNTFRAGFSRAAYNLDPVSLGSFSPSLSFVTGQGPGGITIGGGNTTTGSAALTAAGPNNAANVWNRRNLFTFSDDVQMTKGRHQISFGVWYQRVQDNENGASRTTGVAAFASLATFLAGTVTTFQVVPDPNELGWRSLFGASYVQDTIRLRRNLTIDLGLRDEFTTGWNEPSGRAANYVTDSSGVLLTTPTTSSSLFAKNNAKKLLAPRVGLAWDPYGNGKTSIRAGFGTYYSLIDDLSFLMNSLPPANGSASYAGALLPLLPVTPGVLPPPSCGPGVPTPCTTFAPQGVQADAKTPTVEEWNLRLEQQLSESTVLRVSYVGSHGYHGFVSLDPNSIPAQICQSAAGCASGGNGATKGNVPQGAQYIPVQATRPNPYLGAGFFWYTEGNTSYNALQVDVSHRLRHGLQLRGNFTWSRNLDMNSAFTGAQANNQAQMIMDRNDLSRDWGPSALNVGKQASISGSYELPFGKGKMFANNAGGFAQQLIGGWQLNGIATVLSGFPLTPQDGSNRSGDGDTRNPDRPSINPAFNGQVITGNPNQYFNPNAFVLSAPGTWGTLGRGVYTGPGLGTVDLSLFKRIAISERMNLQFRAECFNVQNRANFGTPNAIVFSNGLVSPSAGLITSTVTTSRQIQFGLKLMF